MPYISLPFLLRFFTYYLPTFIYSAIFLRTLYPRTSLSRIIPSGEIKTIKGILRTIAGCTKTIHRNIKRYHQDTLLLAKSQHKNKTGKQSRTVSDSSRNNQHFAHPLPISAMAGVINPTIISGMINPKNSPKIPLFHSNYIFILVTKYAIFIKITNICK